MYTRASHFERHARVRSDGGIAVGIRQTKTFQRPDQCVVHATLYDNPDMVAVSIENLVEPTIPNKIEGGRPARVDLFVLVLEGSRRQNDPVDITLRILQGIAQRR